MTASAEFRVLGPLEVLKDGSAISVTAPRHQALLVLLALEVNHVVPVSRIVDTIWDDLPPATARSQVQICVSNLRKIVGDTSEEIIVTHAPGYRLHAAAEMVDAIRFEQLLAQGRAYADQGRLCDAFHELRAGLDLWRGHAAAGIESRIVQIAATRLNEERLAAVEECIGLELQLHRHAELIPELTTLVAENPLREKLRAYQMLALYRAGRQAEALEAYQLTRKVFVEELGLEPGEELHRLERAILENDTSLDLEMPDTKSSLSAPEQLAVITPHQLPRDLPDFAGHDDLSDRLRRLLSPVESDDLGNAIPSVVLTGMSGVGKTALAVHVAHMLGDCFPDGQMFLQLSGDSSRPESINHMLKRCLRAFSVPEEPLPDDQAELIEMYRSVLAARRVLVILDDASSVAQITPFLPENSNCAVIVTSRNRLPSLIGAHIFQVDALPPNTSTTLLTRLLDGDQRNIVDADIELLAQLCGHLPLALRIVTAKLIDHPHWTIPQMIDRLANEESRLAELQVGDVGVTTSMSLSYESLSHDAKCLLARLSLLGAVGFGSWAGAPLMDLDINHTDELFNELITHHLVEVKYTSDGVPRFSLHELVRAFAVERLATEQSHEEQEAALHRLLGSWLRLAVEGHRREYGGDFMVLHGTVESWALPRHVVVKLLQEPLNWFRAEHQALMHAIETAAQVGLHEVCWDLAVTSVTFFEANSLVDDWRQSHEVALGAVRRAGNRRGEAALLCSLGELALTEQRLETAESCLRSALDAFEAVHDIHGRGIAGGHLAFVERLRGDVDASLAHYNSALEDMCTARDEVGEAYVLSGMAQVYLARGDHEMVERKLDAALALCARLSVPRIQAQVTHRLAEVYLQTGELERADLAFRSVLRSVRGSGDRMGEAHALHGCGITLARMGSHSAARGNLSAALAISRELGNRALERSVLSALGACQAPT